MVQSRRFPGSTRGEILALLRRGPRTVEELAAELKLTDNAIRSHLAVLERDGMIRQQGVRRGPGAGKPAVVYDLHPDSELVFSRAYPPVLATLLQVIGERMPKATSSAVMRETGRRIAASMGPPQGGPLQKRVQRAATVLRDLGGDVVVTKEGRGYRIQSSGCPLGAAVAKQPDCCLAVETMVSTISGTPARECCERGERPRCAFLVGGQS